MEKEMEMDADIWKSWSEEDEADDLFREEENPTDEPPKLKEYQDDVKRNGMLQVRTKEDWKDEVIEHFVLGEYSDDNKTSILNEIERVGKATCYVQRKCNSQERIDFHKKMKDDTTQTEEVRKCHAEMHEKVLNSRKGGAGTGFLVSPKHLLYGWLVITNNHVIMNDNEAHQASVVFDYLYDNSNRGSKTFSVQRVVSKSIRTKNTDDEESLDYSILSLKCEDSADDTFLKEHAMRFEETVQERMQFARVFPNLAPSYPNGKTPLLAFSHPHGLSKRLSLGFFNGQIEAEYPASHIRHSLPTATGSSGANICFPDPTEKPLGYWSSAFVHYRTKRAVTWQAIAPHLRAETSKDPMWNTHCNFQISNQ